MISELRDGSLKCRVFNNCFSAVKQLLGEKVSGQWFINFSTVQL